MMSKDLIEKVYAFTMEGCPCISTSRVVLGLSGGADSMALLHILLHWPEPGMQVFAVHIHHGLRGDAADRDEAFVRDICSRYGVELIVHHADVAAVARNKHITVEEAGRAVRYEVFERVRQDLRASLILTAHTASDQVETMLMRLIRGTGPDGIVGIPFYRDGILRPLLSCHRSEIEAYCEANDVPYIIDETNIDLQYTRNRIRHEVLPLLRQINPAVDQALLRFRHHVRFDSIYMRGLSGVTLDKAERDAGYDCSVIDHQPFPLRRRMIISLMDRAGVPSIEESHILAAEKAIHNHNGSVSLPGKKVLAVQQGKVSIREADPLPVPDEVKISTLPAVVSFGEEQYTIAVSAPTTDENENVHKLFSINRIDYDKIQGSLYLRTRRTGDRIRPAGRGVSKSIKKLMNELEIPMQIRDRYPLLCDDEGIVLIPGQICDERVRVTEDTKHFLVWQTRKEQG